uniref:Non-haem dioxygenase N-terminal domain-containing protein n=1 Tax=Kalanchoe fedtschenkoi TaxID=63787 RepID=A0A7N0ZSH0_KALFE
MSRRGFSLAPPSPIPTGRGLRSSAINEEILSDFLISSLHVPDLKLPISAQPRRVATSAVDFRSIASRDGESVERVLRRASQFGFFTISGHGILATEIRAAKRGAEYGGEDLRNWEDEGFDFCWAGEEEEDRSEFIPDPDPRKCMEAVAVRLVAIGKSLEGLFSTTTGANDFGTTNLAILQSNVEHRLCESEAPSNGEDKENNALGLYLPSSKCEVLVQVGSESFVFEAGPDTIVAVLGRQYEVDIAGHVTSTPRKLRFGRAGRLTLSDPIVLSIELKLGSPRIQSSERQLDTRRISIIDQILVAGLIVLLFQLVLWIYKTV